MAKQAIITGARAKLSINQRPVGFATDVSCAEDISYEPIRVLDDIYTVEFVPVGYDMSFSAGRVRLFGDSLRSTGTAASTSGLGVLPKHGQNSGSFLTALLEKGDMIATIEDTYNGSVFTRIEGVQVTRHNWTVTARGVVGEDIEFVGKKMFDETESA